MISICKKCGFIWRFPVGACIKCNEKTAEYAARSFRVKGITEVHSRSQEHKEVPYFVLLLEDENGRLSLQKSFQRYAIGQHLNGESEDRSTKPKIGIIGTGVTATGIAQIALFAGCEVTLKSRSEESLKKASGNIRKALSKRVAHIKQLDAAMSLIKPTTDMNDLVGSTLVVEAVIEDLDAKREVFGELDALCDAGTVLASNTSSISIDAIASASNHPERVLGLHFFNPVPKMKLVEVVCGSRTASWAMELAKQTAFLLRKTPVVVKNSPGFIVNRLLMIFLNEAAQALEEGLATKEDIDKAVETGLNYPMGPFKLMDLIGIDIFNDIMDTLEKSMPGRYKHVPMLKQMEDDKLLGIKTGKGFYTYSNRDGQVKEEGTFNREEIFEKH